MHRFLPRTRAALLDLDGPVEVRVRAGHAIARMHGDAHVVAHALLCVWDDLDPSTIAQALRETGERPMHRGFAPDDLLPAASVDDIEAIARAQQRAHAERAAESRRRAALFKPAPVRAPRVRAVRAQPAPSPAPRKRVARAAPTPVASSPRPARAARTTRASASAPIESEPFEPILPVAGDESSRDVVIAAVTHGAGAHFMHADRVAHGVRARLDLPRGEGTLTVDEDMREARLRVSAVAPTIAGAPFLSLTPQARHDLARAFAWWRPRRDDVLGHALLDDAFIMELDAPADRVWLKDVASSLLALRAVKATVRIDDGRIDVTTEWFSKNDHALAALVAAAVTVLYASAQRV